MFCEKCGFKMDDGMRFCMQCGAQVTARPNPAMQPASAAPVATAVPVASAAPAQPTYAQPAAPAAPAQPTYAQPAAPTQPSYAQPAAPAAPAQPTYAQPAAPTAPAQPSYAQPAAPTAPAQPSYAQPAAPAQPSYAQPAAPAQPSYAQPATPAQPSYAQPAAPAQPSYAQPAAPQNTYRMPVEEEPAPAPKKKKPLGLVLGLAIGIPVLVLGAFAGVFFGYIKPNYIDNRDEEVVADIDDDNRYGNNDGNDGGGETTSSDPGNNLPGNLNISPSVVVTPSGDLAKRTVMVYMCGSTLECPEDYGVSPGLATEDIYEMLSANIPSDVNFILECGGAYEWVHPSVPDGVVSRHKIENGQLVMLEDLGRQSMTGKGDLSDFITYASTNFPAENYTLVMWDHGGSIPIGFGMDQLGDEYDLLTDVEIHEELKDANVNFDAVIFDACNMCSLEIGMALKDYAEYMVGAESTVVGIGIDYTNWLNELDDDADDFCETIVKDYMKQLKEYNLVGSMSVIDLGKIQEVYDAYVDYIGAVSNQVNYNGEYYNYKYARDSSGNYPGTDSVDLISLASEYSIYESTALINKVVNAVDYTESDLPYGHGITAYSPSSNNYDCYTDGRSSLVSLNYDYRVIDFYDSFVSQMLATMGSDYVAAYADDWYVDNYTVAEAGAADEVYSLSLGETDYYYYVPLSDDDWDMVYSISMTVAVESDDQDVYLILGTDYQQTQDSDGDLALVDPENWFYINDTLCGYYAFDYYSSSTTNEWSQTGIIPVTVNGNDAFLYVYFDQDNPYGLVQGYYWGDFDVMDIGDTMFWLEDDDIIDIVYQALDGEGNSFFVENEEPFYASSINFRFDSIELDSFTTLGYYTIETWDGDTYETELVYLGSRYNLY